jgi:heme exporter protein A
MILRSLTADKLTCLRGGRVVFRDLSFAVRAGQALTLEGPNGAGKSSLLRMIAGFLAPLSGTITLVTGAEQINEAEDRGRHIGWLGHLDAAKPQMTVRETLTFFSTFYGVQPSGNEIKATLETVGIARLSDLSCQYLSAGQKKRLALARLQLTQRAIWLMDEPFAALDAQGKRVVTDLITTHCNAGGIAIVATHEPLSIACERLTLGGA